METYAFIAVLANKRDNETVKLEELRVKVEGVQGIGVAFLSII